MKKNYFFVLFLFLTSLVNGQNFTTGNLIIFRAGDGSAALTSAATSIFLDVYTPAGALVQSIAVPNSVSGLNRSVTCAGTSTSEGLMTRSTDGQYILFAGYDAAVGTLAIAGTTAAAVNRTVGRLDYSGSINSSTALTDFASTGNARCAFSSNGTDIWVSGSNSGVRYTTLGAFTSTQLSTTPTNIRMVNSFNSQLYITSATGAFQGISSIGSGMPTTSGQSTTALPGFPVAAGPSPFGFSIKPVIGDIAYVADDRAIASGGGIQKWIFSAGTWGMAYTLNSGLITGARNIAVDWSVANPVIYLTDASNRLMKFTDAGGLSTASLLVAAPVNTAFRSVAFVPVIAVLPVKFGNIEAAQFGNSIRVSWSNFTEINIANYVVERSANGVNYTSFIRAVATKNDGTRVDYTVTDPLPIAGVNFYRVGSVDIDGKLLYSAAVKVNIKGDQTSFSVSPNPVSGNQLSFHATALPKGQYVLRMFNAAGQQLYTMAITHNGGALAKIIQLPVSVTTGIYTMQITGDTVKIETKIIVE
jgi:hypothetical protein